MWKRVPSGRRIAAIGATAALVLAACGDDDETVTDDAATQEEQAGGPEWSYSGSTGPENWGSLSPEYAACSNGSEQSPIDLKGGSGAPPVLEIDYGSSPLTLTNNGHSVEAKVEGENTISLDGKAYTLEQFHFHAPSEHTIDGKSFPLELHFVHAADDGSLAVLGVMVEEGNENSAWKGATEALSATPAEGDTADVEDTELESLVTGDAAAERFHYRGSLTTPPCSEGVAWTVFSDPSQMSAEQIAAFTAVYEGTARPVQPLGDREVKFGQ